MPGRKSPKKNPSRAAGPDLMARLGHELRTPLNAILGFSELTLRETFGPVGNARYVEYAKFIHEGARRLLAAVDALHRLARLEQGREPAAREPVDLAEVAARALAAAEARAVERGVALAGGRLGPATVVGDRAMLLEVAGELIANALSFTPAGGRVEVDVTDARGRSRLAVRDNGVGVPPARRRDVFEPFVRLHPAGVDGGGGPGLGLSLARRLARLHGGEVALAPARGGGTVATLELPAPRGAAGRRGRAGRRAL